VGVGLTHQAPPPKIFEREKGFEPSTSTLATFIARVRNPVKIGNPRWARGAITPLSHHFWSGGRRLLPRPRGPA
jgi:hypothetical protein